MFEHLLINQKAGDIADQIASNTERFPLSIKNLTCDKQLTGRAGGAKHSLTRDACDGEDCWLFENRPGDYGGRMSTALPPLLSDRSNGRGFTLLPGKREGRREGFVCVRGAREHNLKNVNVEIPRMRWWSLPAFRDRGNPRWRSARFTLKRSAAISNRSIHTRDDCFINSARHSSTKSTDFRRRWRCSSSVGRRPRGRPLAA